MRFKIYFIENNYHLAADSLISVSDSHSLFSSSTSFVFISDPALFIFLTAFKIYFWNQFTIPTRGHAERHVSLMQDAGAPRALRAAAAASAAPVEARILARLVLRNIEPK